MYVARIPAPRRKPSDTEVLAAYFRALGHPGRLRIVELLSAEGGMSVGEIAERLGMQQGRVSAHLSALRFAGVLSRERERRKLIYSLTNGAVPELLEVARRVSAPAHARGSRGR